MTTKLTPCTPEQCALIDEAARQAKSGEGQAGYWLWLFNVGGIDLARNFPRFTDAAIAKTYEPAPAHPHYATFKEWQRLVDSGEVAKGWWKIYQTIFHSYAETITPNWIPDINYEIRKTDKHPDNCKPALRLIDKSALPVGTMTIEGEIVKNYSIFVHVLDLKKQVCSFYTLDHSHLRLAPQTKFTYLQDGEVPPVIDGVIFEYEYVSPFYYGTTITHYLRCITRNRLERGIIAYRIIGVDTENGWTDDPEKASK